MPYCSNCGMPYQNGANFCNSCGKPTTENNDIDNIDVEMTISVKLDKNGQKTEYPLYVQHLSKTITVSIPNNITEGQVLRLKGLGRTLPTGKKGDLYVYIDRINYEHSSTETYTDSSQRKQEWAGKVVKCPSCGELLNSFTANCPACGYEIRGTSNSSSVKDLFARLDRMEEKRENEKLKTSYISLLLGNAWKVQKTDEQKINLIRSFPIPNTKEDLLEFMIMASSNIDMQVYGTDSQNISAFQAGRRQISDAWLAKFEQAYNKAQIMFGTSQEFAMIKEIYYTKIEALKKEKRKLPLMVAGLFGLLVLLILLCFAGAFLLS